MLLACPDQTLAPLPTHNMGASMLTVMTGTTF